MILVLHAYSRKNRGDGLLVDMTLDLIQAAFPDERTIVMAAMDPGSFPGLEVVPTAGAGLSGVSRAAHAASTAAGLVARCFGLPFRDSVLSSMTERADLIVAVGGGYMRCSGFIEGLKASIAHTAQVFVAGGSGRPCVYLPQSVGPFLPPFGFLMRRALNNIETIFLRDDRSMRELEGHAGATRSPDLAILGLFDRAQLVDFPDSYHRSYLIARRLDRPASVRKGYVARLKRLRELLPEMEIALQSVGRGNDDAAFYRSLGWGSEFRPITKAVHDSGPGVVVSVRLHGSLQSLMDGCPSVHLSYERKGWGAYDDLGIMPYVHNAATFDPENVAEQVRALQANARPYWTTIAEAAPAIAGAKATILRTLREARRAG